MHKFVPKIESFSPSQASVNALKQSKLVNVEFMSDLCNRQM